jgi:hypothetical protein
MDEFAYAMGHTICQTIIGLTGASTSRCYNATDMQTLGWSLVILLAVALLTTRVMARMGR